MTSEYSKDYEGEFSRLWALTKKDPFVWKKIDFISKNLLILPDRWIERLDYEASMPYENQKALLQRALFDFYSEEIFNSYPEYKGMLAEEKPFDRSLSGKWVQELLPICESLMGTPELELILKEALSFPHRNLRIAAHYFEAFSVSPYTKEDLTRYQNLQSLYSKIYDTKDDVKKWFEAVCETEDDRFIIQNAECAIAKKPFIMDLWKLYIRFLYFLKDGKAAFEVYSRYRRLFLKDKSLDYLFVRYKSCRRENEYLQGMKFKQPTLKRKFDQISPSRLQDYELPGIQPPSNQSFPFRAPLMQYLISHASPRRMQKLYFSCKYFFFKVRKPICHFLYLGNKVESKFFKQFMAVDDPESRNLKNVCLSNSIYVDTLDSKCLSNVIPKLSIISLNFFTLRHQNISVNEYFLLTKSLTTFAIKLDNVSIEDDEGCPIAFEDFFSTLSRAQIIELVSISFSTLERFPENEVANYRSPSELSVTSKTNDRISKIEKTSKFWTFKLNVTDKLFDLNLNNLFTFLYKHCGISTTVQFNFKENTDEMVTFQNSLKLANREFHFQHHLPPLRIIYIFL